MSPAQSLKGKRKLLVSWTHRIRNKEVMASDWLQAPILLIDGIREGTENEE
jgi:hypothetical protein